MNFAALLYSFLFWWKPFTVKTTHASFLFCYTKTFSHFFTMTIATIVKTTMSLTTTKTTSDFNTNDCNWLTQQYFVKNIFGDFRNCICPKWFYNIEKNSKHDLNYIIFLNHCVIPNTNWQIVNCNLYKDSIADDIWWTSGSVTRPSIQLLKEFDATKKGAITPSACHKLWNV